MSRRTHSRRGAKGGRHAALSFYFVLRWSKRIEIKHALPKICPPPHFCVGMAETPFTAPVNKFPTSGTYLFVNGVCPTPSGDTEVFWEVAMKLVACAWPIKECLSQGRFALQGLDEAVTSNRALQQEWFPHASRRHLSRACARPLVVSI